MRRLYYFPTDALNLLLGRTDPLVPPRGVANAGGGGDENFKEIGATYLRHFVELGDLKPEDRILDVGCGVGRMAAPLTGYMNEKGSYEGFDVVAEGVRWCQKNITPRFPNFRFRVADIYNSEYNHSGKFKASEYVFPHEDGSFDFVFLTSVFTHLLPDEVDNYLAEISRVSKPGGRCLAATFFLLNEESLELLEADKGFIDFRHDFGKYRVKEKYTPEAAIAYDESFIRSLLAKHGLRLEEPVHYGSWCGRSEFLDGHDIMVAQRVGKDLGE